MAGVKALKERRGRLRADMQKIIDRAENLDRDLTELEEIDFKQLHEEDLQLASRIKRQEKMEAHNAELDELDPRAALLRGGVDPGFNRDGRRQAPVALFRDERTGRVVEALRPQQSLAEFERRHLAESDSSEDNGDVPGDFAGRLVQYLGTGRVSAIEGVDLRSAGSYDGSGGYLIAPNFGANVLDLARSASVAVRAGALTVRMDSPEQNLVRLASDPTSYWRHEGVAVTATDMTLDRVKLQARTLAAILSLPIEMLEDAPNVAQVVTQALQASMGLALDQAVLGVGSVEPARPIGILGATGVNSIGSVGTPANYSKITEAIGDILGANYPGEISGLSWVLHPRDGETIDKFVSSADDQPLMPTAWVKDLKRYFTTSLPKTDGGGSNESSMIIGDFSQCLIGMRTSGVNIRVLDSGSVIDALGTTHNAASELKKLVVAYMRADTVLMRPSWFTKLTGITAT